MPITRRNYSSVYYDGKNRIQSYTPVNNFNPQGITKAYLDVISAEMEKLYDAGEYLSRAIDPTKAVGVDLENAGFLVGERRRGATLASDPTYTNFYFYIDKKLNWSVHVLLQEMYTPTEISILVDSGYVQLNSSTNEYYITLPNGHQVTNVDGSVAFTTSETIDITDKANAYAPIVATSTGPSNNVETNTLIRHTIHQIPELRKIARYIKCTNTFPIQNGSFSQSDDQLRYRISTKSSAFNGNELSIRRAVIAIPGIRDILYEKNKFGAGTAHIIVDSNSPLSSQGLISAVKQVAENTASYGDLIFVSRPEYLGAELNFSIRVEPGTSDPLSLRNQARAAIVQYINDLPIGGEIVWNRIVSIVLDTPGVIDFIPNYFKHGKYDIVNKINKEQIVLRFINQRAKYNQKWYCDVGMCVSCLA